MQERYSRNFNTLSEPEQAKLQVSTVCIVGLGGLGGSVAELLARTGIGCLILVDGDVFELSNLNRQILCTEDVLGKSKSETAKNRIQAVNSSVQVKAVQSFFTPGTSEAILSGADLVVDCLDSIQARFELESAAKKAMIPMVTGAIAGTCGQVMTVFPEDKGLELIYGPKDLPHPEGAEKITGNLSFCASFIASVQASEAVKTLLGRGKMLRNQLFVADLMNCEFDCITLI